MMSSPSDFPALPDTPADPTGTLPVQVPEGNLISFASSGDELESTNPPLVGHPSGPGEVCNASPTGYADAARAAAPNPVVPDNPAGTQVGVVEDFPPLGTSPAGPNVFFPRSPKGLRKSPPVGPGVSLSEPVGTATGHLLDSPVSCTWRTMSPTPPSRRSSGPRREFDREQRSVIVFNPAEFDPLRAPAAVVDLGLGYSSSSVEGETREDCMSLAGSIPVGAEVEVTTHVEIETIDSDSDSEGSVQTEATQEMLTSQEGEDRA
jgi:hypothetical protein